MCRLRTAVVLILAAVHVYGDDKRHASCRHCGESEREARLVETCGKVRVGALSAAEAAKYCRWVVRVAPLAADRQRVITPQEAAEHRAIGAAIAPLVLVQPPQIQAQRASVLAERAGATSGDFAVVSLVKRGGQWRVDQVTEAGR